MESDDLRRAEEEESVMNGRPQAARREVEVLLVGFDDVAAERLAGELAPLAEVSHATTAAEAEGRLRRRAGGVVCVGGGVAAADAARLLRRTPVSQAAAGGRVDIVLAGGADPSPFQDLLDEDRLFYLSRRPPAADEVRELLAAAVERVRTAAGGSAPSSVDDQRDLDARRTASELCRQVARAADVATAAESIARAARRLVDAERTRCLVYDAASETFGTGAPAGAHRRDPRHGHSAAAGLIGYAIRTGRPLCLDRVGDDPRWDSEADTPHGAPGERLLALPIFADGLAGGAAAPPRVWAVVVATRSAAAPPFSAADQAALAAMVRQVTPVVGVFTLRRDLDELAVRRIAGAGGESSPLFRRRAIDHHSGTSQPARGRPLEVSPAWTRRAFSVILAVVGTALAFATVASIDEHARGPAVVRASGRTDLTAPLPGTVAAIHVVPGQSIAAGELLLGFHGAGESAELARIDHELELALAQRLRDPADRAVEARLQGLRASRDHAAARLAALSVRAPHAGVVGEVRARPGRFVAAGEVLVSLAGDRGELTVLAMLPGHYRSALQPGMTLRLELEGFRYAYQELEIERISEKAVGAVEARRILGAEIADAVSITAPVVFASARVPSTGEFRAGGRGHPYHEGLRGRAEVRVRSQRVLSALLPGLKALVGDGDE